MFLIVTALYCEAKPLIEYFNLKRCQEHKRCEIYASEEISLIISGTGMIKSAAAVAYLLGLYCESIICGVANIGICGAVSQNHSIGKPIHFNKIVNHSTQRAYYPDMIITLGVEESYLHSFTHAVTKETITGIVNYVDMEAAGFMEAAFIHLPPNKVFCIKIVSDHLDAIRLKPDFVSCIINENVHIIDDLIAMSVDACKKRNKILTIKDYKMLDALTERLMLSDTMKYQLRELIMYYRLHTGNDPCSVLEKYEHVFVKSKREGKIVLQELREVLSGE